MDQGDKHLGRAGFKPSRIWAKVMSIWAEQDLGHVGFKPSKIWAEVMSILGRVGFKLGRI